MYSRKHSQICAMRVPRPRPTLQLYYLRQPKKGTLLAILGHIIYPYPYVGYKVVVAGEDIKMMDENELNRTSNGTKLLQKYKATIQAKRRNKNESKNYMIHNKKTKDLTEDTIRKILSHRSVGGKEMYLVAWHGWKSSVFNTEHSEAEFRGNCRAMLQEYKRASSL
ncbi:Protein CBG27432 [Caenorhabditis briggsae]|uniref:Protein CBG27432 n=1 Tax=Caenorhabditis briggsae TaxID=6238 RepID=B6IK09_CAEBR|nr:Protein CBG27432 [Caenorhabditis briggsae]CAS00239.1 Protein CBG27432 [Caenorhabditis briggsae]